VRSLTLVVGALLLSAHTPVAAFADATEATDCWNETRVGPDLQELKVTVCLLEGGSIETYYSFEAGERPPMIDVNLGHDTLGTECWWRTAYDTPWVKLDEFTDGVALVGYQPPGAIETVVDAFVPSCTSQPLAAGSALASAWELANRHIHQRPGPSFNPDVGITGLDTFLAIQLPPPITDSLISPIGTTVTVEIKVVELVVDWGDGRAETFTESAFSHLTGYPDGIARHGYETKTCPTPGGPRCHPTLSEYQIGVEFDWFVRWRVDAGAWSTIAVPNITATVPYQVDEIVSRSVANP